MKDKLFCCKTLGAKVYNDFGEAVFYLIDKDSKSKMLPQKIKRKKPKPDYKQQQIKKWKKKVDHLQMAVDWLSQHCYYPLEQCQKEKPPQIKLEIKDNVYQTLGVWNQELKKAKRKLNSANKFQIQEIKKKKIILELNNPKKLVPIL